MEKYIPKSALVAKLKRRIKSNKECMLGLKNLDYYQGRVDALNDTLFSLDTLEVKEVDLKKDFSQWWKSERIKDYNVDILYEKYSNVSMKLAKHFFELGLKAKNNQDKWNKTNTKPPFTTTMDGNKYSDPMLCYDKFGNYCIAQYVRLHTGHCGWYDGEEEVSITHWKELKAQKGERA